MITWSVRTASSGRKRSSKPWNSTSPTSSMSRSSPLIRYRYVTWPIIIITQPYNGVYDRMPSRVAISWACHLAENIKVKLRWNAPITDLLARNWSRCTGSQPAGDFSSHPRRQAAIASPNVTVFWPVPSYTAWWQRQGANCQQLAQAKLFTQLCLGGHFEPTTYLSQA